MYTSPWYKQVLVVLSAVMIGCAVGWSALTPIGYLFGKYSDEFDVLFAFPIGMFAFVASFIGFAWWWGVTGIFREDTAIGAMILARHAHAQTHAHYERIMQRAAVGRAQSLMIGGISGSILALAVAAIGITQWTTPRLFNVFYPAARVPGIAGFVVGGILFPLFLFAPAVPILGLIYVLLRGLWNIVRDMQ